MGKPYPYEMYTHCGIRAAYFDGRRWIADPILQKSDTNPLVGLPDPPAGWANPFDIGTMELVTDDRARFTSSTGLIAEFRPLPEGTDYPPWVPCL